MIDARPDGSARITMNLTYTRPTGEVDLTEARVLDVSAPAPDGGYTIDWSMRFTAGKDGAVLDRTPMPGEPNGVDLANIAERAPWYIIDNRRDFRFICAAILTPAIRTIPANGSFALHYRVAPAVGVDGSRACGCDPPVGRPRLSSRDAVALWR